MTYDDLRVIGGNPGNANQDGMDWLGGGDSVVRNAFIRSSDDDFAMEGNWDGYKDEDMLRPGHDVANILIMNSVLSTSISNIVRAGWPRKIFNSRNFTLRDSDILHGGIGACGQTFGLLGFWGAQEAKGGPLAVYFRKSFPGQLVLAGATGAETARVAWVQFSQHLGAGPAAAGRFHNDRRRSGRDL